LSGGERIRVRLAELLQQSINTLIFDEPTNHIDIPTKESLEEAIEDFDGTLLAISHDRFFINKFVDKIIEVDSGRTTEYLGNYDFYVRKKEKAQQSQQPQAGQATHKKAKAGDGGKNKVKKKGNV
jgi:ATP-binding cassette subfamily F protein 3